MTYLVLARKWRPRSFDTLIGQDHVVRALTNALSSGRLHHAWLFTGTRGVGKTTLSRLLAKSLNCETGITATPCGVCRACTEIDSGRFVDYLELDAASNRGVDEMTQLLEQAAYAPSVGRFKVYMIDEVHMLTGHAFNAMLKTLEEPPAHVKFILATTDPQKIPVTVLSRCLQFNLKLMTAQSMVAHLQNVLGQEKIDFEVPALRLIAQAASGSMRDALSLTDQAIAYSAGHLTTAAIQDMLGTVDQRHLVRLLQALSAGSAMQVLRVADELATRGLSYAGALADLALLLSRIAIEQRVSGTIPDDDPLAADIGQLVRLMHPDLVQLFYSVAVHSRHELALAPDEYAGFVMACLRMLALAPPAVAPEPDDKAISAADQADTADHDSVAADAADGDSQDIPAWEDAPPVDVDESFAGNTPVPPTQPVPPTPPIPPTPTDNSEPAEDEINEPIIGDDSALEMTDHNMDEGAVGVFAPEREKLALPALSDMTAGAWPALAVELPLSGLAAELARQSEWSGSEGNQINLRVAVRSLAENSAKSRLCTVLSEHFGMVVSLRVDYGATGEETARAVEQAHQAVLQEQAEQAAHADPLVRALMTDFGARVVPDSIRPASDSADVDIAA